mmetsp:Transcript_26335/g.82017  ORF Transcript_26335/g.82017 Transcript_26335/m.82017 type:complete len:246 (-) Transcript_26335:586-1323(-)
MHDERNYGSTAATRDDESERAPAAHPSHGLYLHQPAASSQAVLVLEHLVGLVEARAYQGGDGLLLEAQVELLNLVRVHHLLRLEVGDADLLGLEQVAEAVALPPGALVEHLVHGGEQRHEAPRLPVRHRPLPYPRAVLGAIGLLGIAFRRARIPIGRGRGRRRRHEVQVSPETRRVHGRGRRATAPCTTRGAGARNRRIVVIVDVVHDDARHAGLGRLRRRRCRRRCRRRRCGRRRGCRRGMRRS